MIIEHSSNLITKIEPIRAFTDNYIWAISIDQNLIIVDPGDAKPVFDYIKTNNMILKSILITHKHPDHIGGVRELLDIYPKTKIFAPKNSLFNFPFISVSDDEEIFIEDMNLKYKVIETPGHTLDHVVYYDDRNLFCGDTLFGCGCGRLFEGTFEQMFHSLKKLKKLNPSTKVFCAHEYTLKNIEFAMTVYPRNNQIKKRYKKCINLNLTLPSSIKEELKTNPFLLAQNIKEFKDHRLKKDAF